MDYLVLVQRIADHFEHEIDVSATASNVGQLARNFLNAHSMCISDIKLQQLEYAVRAEVQRRILRSRLGLAS